MTDVEKKEMETLIKYGTLDCENVHIFGCNGYLSYILDVLSELGIKCDGILDNNKNKQGKEVNGISVFAPDEIIGRQDEIRVLIASAYYSEMKNQLINYGVSECNVISVLPNCGAHISWEQLNQKIMDYKKGHEIIQKCKQKYGKIDKIIYIPVTSVGDVYLLDIYLKKYYEENRNKNIIILIPGKAAYGLLKQNGYKNVEQISALESYYIYLACIMTEYECGLILLMHTGFLHFQHVDRLMTYRNATWLDNYKLLLGLDDKERFTNRKRDNSKRNAGRNWVTKSNSVVLSPYAKTIDEIDSRFWLQLACELNGLGYTVYTNVTKSENEIPGTLRMDVTLDDAFAEIEHAGYFVGLRSGLCDVICENKAKKIILYPRVRFDYIKVIDMYGFGRMEIGENISEFEYDLNEDYAELVRKVIILLGVR